MKTEESNDSKTSIKSNIDISNIFETDRAKKKKYKFKKINNLEQLQSYQKREAYDKVHKQYEYKKFLSMKKLSESLEDPYHVNNTKNA